MKRILATTAVTLFLLAGCTSSPATNAPASEELAAPAIDPGPVELTDEEAADRYLAIVCQPNIASGTLVAAFDAGEPEFLNGGSPSVEAVVAAANERMRVTRQAIELLDDTYYTWPKSVSEPLTHIRSSYMTEMATFSQMINAATFEDAYYAPFPPATPEQQSAGQEIRYQLKLDADTTATCEGKDAAQDEAHAEMTERNELLAKQE